jgi:3-hydroxyisobutyrate dehydrogenase/2-hydroxy-3-oxopropionate reductase
VSSVSVLGMGAMGSRIARRLLDAGHEVVVWNRTPAKAEPLVAAGARSAATPAEAARGAEAVITMLAGPDALMAVVEAQDGLATGAGDGTTVLEMSTVGPGTIERLRSALPPGDGLVARWTPLLQVLGEPIHVGALGMGAATKLVTNATLVGTMTLLGETIALADALGVPRGVAFRALSVTPLAAQAERRREPLATGEFRRRFELALASKDARLVVEAARAAGLDAKVLEAAETWFAAAEQAGLGERDYSEVLRTILEG